MVLRTAASLFVLLAHLQEDGVTVTVGDEVEVGQSLAKVGNSGNTTQPHLHIQAMTKPDLFGPRQQARAPRRGHRRRRAAAAREKRPGTRPVGGSAGDGAVILGRTPFTPEARSVPETTDPRVTPDARLVLPEAVLDGSAAERETGTGSGAA